MEKNIYVVKLDRPVYGGDCMGRLPDGRAVFVPFGLPGEKLQIQLVEEKRGYTRGRLLEVIDPSAHRITPRCKHYQKCGGCHLQHTDYAYQLELKRDVMIDQLQRIAGIANPPVTEVVASPQEWNYRNNIQFHLSPNGKLGFQGAGSNELVEIEECYLPEPALDQTWRQLDLEAFPDLSRLSLRAGLEENILLEMEGTSPDLPELAADFPISVVHTFAGHSVVLAGSDHVVMKILDRPFRVSAPSFFQVNTHMAEKMVKHILDILPPKFNQTLFDLYCGVGLFSAFLAPRVSRCIGIELSPSACDDYSVNLDEFDHVELYQGMVEEVLPALRAQNGQVVIDPPRAGLEKTARDAILRLHPEIILYISCDPATLSRDLRIFLSQGYQLIQVTPFDLFPQTFHIESISLLVHP